MTLPADLTDEWPDDDRREAALEHLLLRVMRAAIVEELGTRTAALDELIRASSEDRPTSLRVRRLADMLAEEGHSQLAMRLHDVARELEAAGA